jgi:carbon monoxide dehydrogenase subunit G
MIFKEEFFIEAPLNEAWEFLSTFPGPIQVLPGVQQLKKTGPASYKGTAKVGFGPAFTFIFHGEMHITLIDHLAKRVHLTGGAQDPQLGGHFTATAYTQTLAYGHDRSRVIIEVHVGLGGLLGSLGLFILRPAARQITQRYSYLVNREIKRKRAQALRELLTPEVAL